MPSALTIKGQVTIPKAVRDAAGLQPGDQLEVRMEPGIGVVVSKASNTQTEKRLKTLRKVLADMAKRRPYRGPSTEDLMALTRGED